MKNYTTTAFWSDTAERAIKTAAQTLLGVLTTGAVGLLDVDWANAASITALATLISILTSIASAGSTDTISPASILPAPTGKHIEVVE